MKQNLFWAVSVYLMMSAFGAPLIVEALEYYARESERNASVYALPSQVEFIDMDGVTIVTGVTSKLTNCSVPKGSDVIVIGSWTDNRGNRHVRDFPALRPEGGMVKTSPLVVEGDEFVIGPFVLSASFGIINDVYIRFPCVYPSGVKVTAQIGPLSRTTE